MKSKLMIAAALAASVAFAAAPAQARWHGHHGGGWHHGGGFGGALGGFAAGAIIGGALGAASSGPYYDYGPDYYGYGYAPGPVVVERSGGGAEAYCERRFRSYDPASGTYLGYDGMRHPCP